MIEHQDFSFELKGVTDAGTFTGYASVFGVKDDGYDIVEKGAFAQTLADLGVKNRKVPMLWAHDSRMPIGHYTTLREDDKGLWVEGKFAKGVAKADEIHLLMKEGVIDGLSIGFRTKVYKINTDTGIRHLQQVDLFEISCVTFPMNDVSRVVGVKSSFRFDPREFERELKEGGLSNRDAVSAVAIAKKYLQRDAGGSHPARDAAWANDVLESLRQARQSITS